MKVTTKGFSTSPSIFQSVSWEETMNATEPERRTSNATTVREPDTSRSQSRGNRVVIIITSLYLLHTNNAYRDGEDTIAGSDSRPRGKVAQLERPVIIEDDDISDMTPLSFEKKSRRPKPLGTSVLGNAPASKWRTSKSRASKS
jgi:hypothetical protein